MRAQAGGEGGCKGNLQVFASASTLSRQRHYNSLQSAVTARALLATRLLSVSLAQANTRKTAKPGGPIGRLRPRRARGDDGQCYTRAASTTHPSAKEREGEKEASETHLRTVAAAVVETVHAPPAVVFLQALQCQMPTAVRLTESCEAHERQRPAPPHFVLAHHLLLRRNSSTAVESRETNLAAEGATARDEPNQHSSPRARRNSESRTHV